MKASEVIWYIIVFGFMILLTIMGLIAPMEMLR
jgi:hypothetical protein